MLYLWSYAISITEGFKKQTEPRINSRFIMHVDSIHQFALKNTERGRRYGKSAEPQKLERAGDYLNSAKKHSCGTTVERYLEDEQSQTRTHEQGYTQSDVEEFDRVAGEKGLRGCSWGKEKAYYTDPIQSRTAQSTIKQQHCKDK